MPALFRRETLIATGIASIAALCIGACGGDGPEVEADPRFGEQPNFVFVLTDDQNLQQYRRETMPFTYDYMGRNATTFDLHRAATPLCCPSRAAMLTGQYGHNNRVLSNVPGWGILDDPENILPIWLQRVGYRTGYIGKFLNGYEKTVDKHKQVPPGWDEWYGLIGAHGYYDFKVSDNGKKDVHDGDRYLTSNLNKRAVRMVEDFAAGEEPFFMQLSQLAPHVENFQAESEGRCGAQAVPAPGDLEAFDGEGLPDSPSINEPVVSDKPTFVTGKVPLTRPQLERLETRYECREASLLAVDRGIRALIMALEASGELARTVFVFGSDNGTFHGEHRLPGGKGLAYEEASRIPLVIMAPERFRGGAPLTRRVAEPTANIDLVPTIVELAGAPACNAEGCRVMDGRSLVPLLSGEGDAWPDRRPILTELNLNAQGVDVGRGISCTFQGVFDGRWAYFRHTLVPDPALGSCAEQRVIEQYDLERDPFELENLAVDRGAAGDRARAARGRLERALEQLSDCAGIEGRDTEPESGHWCS